jgi:hypothetical protein
MNGFRANGGKDLKFDFPIHMTKPGTPLDPTSKRSPSFGSFRRMLTFSRRSLHRSCYHRALLHEQRDSRLVPPLRIR